MKKLLSVIVCLSLLLSVPALAASPEDFRAYALSHGFAPDDGTFSGSDAFPADIACCICSDAAMTLGDDQIPAVIVILSIYGDVYCLMGLDAGDPASDILGAAEARQVFAEAAAALPWDAAFYGEDAPLFSFGASRFPDYAADSAQTGSEYDTLADFNSAVSEYIKYKG